MKKKELCFIAAVLAVAAILWGAQHLLPKEDSGSIKITVDGELYGTYSLGKDQTVQINDTNVCEIRDGKAHMLSATCPDQLCIYQGDIDENGGIIICLPNLVMIEGESASSGDQGVDAVSGR